MTKTLLFSFPQLQLQLLFFVPFLQILSYSVSYEKSQREAAKEQ
ncbi:putative citrate transporter [Enterococcus faecium E980]|nr:putative citrate transporter [Enterococcus faecium E980]